MAIALHEGTVETGGDCDLPEVVQLPSEPVGSESVASGCPPVRRACLWRPVNFSRMACCCTSQSGSAERRAGFRGFTLAGELWRSRVGGETVALK